MATKTEKPDAIALLKADHRKVEGLFEKFERAKSDSVKQRRSERDKAAAGEAA